MARTFHHVGFTVKDLDTSLEFYCGKLGFKLISKSEDYNDSTHNSIGIGVEGASIKIANVEMSDGTTIELLEYRSPKSEVECAVKPSSIGSAHIGYWVDSVTEEVARLKSLGVDTIPEPQRDSQLPQMWVYFRDPDGIPVEIMGGI